MEEVPKVSPQTDAMQWGYSIDAARDFAFFNPGMSVQEALAQGKITENEAILIEVGIKLMTQKDEP